MNISMSGTPIAKRAKAKKKATKKGAVKRAPIQE